MANEVDSLPYWIWPRIIPVSDDVFREALELLGRLSNLSKSDTESAHLNVLI